MYFCFFFLHMLVSYNLGQKQSGAGQLDSSTLHLSCLSLHKWNLIEKKTASAEAAAGPTPLIFYQFFLKEALVDYVSERNWKLYSENIGML